MAACTKADEYKQYTSSGEVVYTAAVDSLHIYPGYKRAQVNWLLLGDPKVSKARIYWNNKLDSLDVPLKRTGGTDTFQLVIDPLPEGPMVFTVRTFDDKQGASIPVEGVVQVYGDNYIAGLQNRALHVAAWVPTGPVTGMGMLNWASVQQFAVGEEVYFTDADGKEQKIVEPNSDAPTLLPNYQANTLFHYTTLFLPDVHSIDTFRARFDTGFIAGPPGGRIKSF